MTGKPHSACAAGARHTVRTAPLTRQQQRRLLELFVAQERLIGAFYQTCAKAFPQHEEFWQTLAREEATHATWLLDLAALVDSGRARFHEGIMRVKTIGACMTYLGDVTARAGKNELDMQRAAAIALDIEVSLIERGVFRHFRGDSPEVKETFCAMNAEIGEHVRKVRKMFRRSIRTAAQHRRVNV